jgi:hypothetical protein
MSISDNEFDTLLAAHFEHTELYDDGDDFTKRTIQRLNRISRVRMLIKWSSFLSAVLATYWFLPWQGIWVLMTETPVDLTVLTSATSIALLIQLWAYLRFQQ